MLTVHVIFNAHLDPIWLWPWHAGIDEALSTCRSACERLDANPDVCFSQGEAWVYHQVERLDPGLFKRIREHIAAGRWEIIGGWWTQPDCNFPEEIGIRHQIQMGRDYFLDTFGQFPEIGFNPDSFGHNASLPRIMNEFGQKKYVFMRPQEHEKSLPGRLFRWRGVGGGELTTFRIARAYCCREMSKDFLRACTTELPEGIEHTACFCGVGDHGGGPTETLIRQIRELAAEAKDLKIVFSTAKRFFDAIAGQEDKLPVVEGELQHHAVGCYTVHRAGKTALKAATQRLRQVETAFENYPESKTDCAAAMLRDHWRNVVFHQFHDTLGGTCLPSAYRHVQNELGAAEEWGNALLNDVLRIRMRQLSDDEHQRIMLYNASDVPYDGWMEVEPWMGLRGWHDEFGVFDEQNQAVPFQKILNESLTGGNRLAVRVKVAPGQIMALHIDDKKEEEAFEEPAFTGDAHCMGNQLGAAVALYPPEMMVGSWSFALPDVLLYPDNSDTWSHGIDRYPDKDETLPTWGVPQVLNDGKHVREIAQRGRIGNSDLLRRFRIYSDTGAVELLLRVDWQEHNKVLKLVMPVEAGGDMRTDGIPGAHIDRAQDGAERPVRDWTMVPLDAEEKLAIVSPDVFALDGTKDRLRLTLLRSPQMAHHDPYPGGRLDGRYSDRGEHDFHFWFMAGADVTPEKLDQLATMMQRPLITADYTRGMKPFM